MTSEDEKIETCRVAMKAALEAIQDYCGTGEPDGRYIKFAGETVEYPDSVQDIMDGPAPDSQADMEAQIERIAALPWTEEIAREQCKGMYSEELPAFDECIKWMSMDIARAVIFQRRERVK